jgi:outer membrane lipoprotein-sorting protein
MKQTHLLFLIFFIVMKSIFAENATDESLLSHIDTIMRYPASFYSECESITLTEDAVYETHHFSCCIQQSNTVLLVITSPESKKESGLLKKGDSWWMYNPRINIFFPSKANEPIDTTALSISDFLPVHYESLYELVSMEKTTLGIQEVMLLHLDAKPENASCDRAKLWILEKTLLPVREECFSEQGISLKTRWFLTWNKQDNCYLPVGVLVECGENKVLKTILVINRIIISPLPDYVFTRSFMEFLGD